MPELVEGSPIDFMTGKLVLEDGSQFDGVSFAANTATSGEVVFATGMMGYPESLTDPSYKGQILILTYPLVGNYGVPNKNLWESNNIQVSGLIVSNYINTPSHFQSRQTLADWFKEENVPLLEIKDTRLLTQKIREKGAMLGKITFGKDITQYDPNTENLVAKVSTSEVTVQRPKKGQGLRVKGKEKIIVLIDCGAKRNIQKALLKRGVTVVTVPWDFDVLGNLKQLRDVIASGVKTERGNLSKKIASSLAKPDPRNDERAFDGVLISNGPGDPTFVTQTVQNIKRLLDANIPTMGICLGHQLLALAAGGKTQKLKYGHRSQNQPCTMASTSRCYITTQNHGFAVSEIPAGFKPWFTNANDGSNEGIHHKTKPFFSVQFHPEATPGPEDAEWLFDYFLEKI